VPFNSFSEFNKARAQDEEARWRKQKKLVAGCVGRGKINEVLSQFGSKVVGGYLAFTEAHAARSKNAGSDSRAGAAMPGGQVLPN
jgi:hypothetical protein